MMDQDEKAQSSTETGKSGSKPGNPQEPKAEPPIIVKGGSLMVIATGDMNNQAGQAGGNPHVLTSNLLMITQVQICDVNGKEIATFPFDGKFLIKFLGS